MNQAFLKLVNRRFTFNLYLLAKLPSAFFSGVRLLSISADRCVVTVPFKWFSQNPFRSTYFACLSMAAEMSTGLLAMINTYQSVPAISMLVTQLESEFFKKATGKTFFTCEDGLAMTYAIHHAVETGDPVIFKATSVGKNKEGETVAIFYITWSFKVKPKQV